MKAISREAFDLSHFNVHVITLPGKEDSFGLSV